MKTPRLLALWFGLLLCVVARASIATGVEYVTVQSEGEGATLMHATSAALSSAVAEVNGAAVAANLVTSELHVALDSESESISASASSSAEVISQQTRGLVRDYRVLAKTQNNAIWRVVIEANIPRYVRSSQTDRLRMSVLPFRVLAPEHANVRDQFVEALNTYLTQSRRFAMLDRQYEAERQSEMAINASVDAPIEEMARLGNRLGTDYMVVGTLDRAQTNTRSTELAGRTLTSSAGSFAVTYRIIDAATGQVKFSDSWTRSAEGTSVERLAGQAAESIARSIVDAIAPILVERVSGNVLFLGQGGSSVKVGQIYRLLHYGENIVDSYSGESLGREEHEVGLIEITEVQAKFSKARVLQSNVDIAHEFAPAKFVVRLDTSAHSNTHGAPASTAAETKPVPRQRSESLHNNLEEDW